MTRDEGTAFVNRMLQLMNEHDEATLASLYTEDALVVSPTFGQIMGREAIEKSYRRIFNEVFPNFAIAPVSAPVIDTDRLVMFAAVNFIHSLPLLNVPASGARVGIHTVVIDMTFRADKIAYETRMWDATSIGSVLEKLQLDRELKAAAEVQRALLPRHDFGLDYCDIAGASIPCRMIGGDFFESIELPSSSGVGIALGDVSGKGPPAALLASMIQGMFACEVEAGCGPAEMMGRINRLLLKRSIEPRFATFFYGVLASDGRFTYANAGHNPPFLISRFGRRPLTVGGGILGALEHLTFEEETIELQPSDAVVCFTDGVTEAMDSRGEEFGEERLIDCLDHCRNRPATDVISHVFGIVRQFCATTAQRDDITMVVLRFLSTRSTREPGGEVGFRTGHLETYVSPSVRR
jgi:stage II sporulation SpoE-like protein/SnoaL-like protein